MQDDHRSQLELGPPVNNPTSSQKRAKDLSGTQSTRVTTEELFFPPFTPSHAACICDITGFDLFTKHVV